MFFFKKKEMREKQSNNESLRTIDKNHHMKKVQIYEKKSLTYIINKFNNRTRKNTVFITF